MNELTKRFMENLAKCKSKGQAKDFIITYHEQLKTQLEELGYKMYPREFRPVPELGPHQPVQSKDKNMIDHFEEIGYILRGVTTGWATVLDSGDRFERIKQEVQVIYDHL